MGDLFGWQPTTVTVLHGQNRVAVTGSVRLRAKEGGAEIWQEGGSPVTLNAETIIDANVPGASLLDRRQHSLAAAFLLGYVRGDVVHGPVPPSHVTRRFNHYGEGEYPDA